MGTLDIIILFFPLNIYHFQVGLIIKTRLAF